MTFWGQAERVGRVDLTNRTDRTDRMAAGEDSDRARERLAEEIIEASGPMMDAEAHRRWLETLRPAVLRERLAVIRNEQAPGDGAIHEH